MPEEREWDWQRAELAEEVLEVEQLVVVEGCEGVEHHRYAIEVEIEVAESVV